MPLRNNATHRGARRSPSSADDVRSTLDALSLAVSIRRRSRFVDAFAAAFFASAFACCGLDATDARAQIFPSEKASAQNYAARSSSQSSAQTGVRRNAAASKSPLFSGKFARGVSEKFSRDAAPQTGSTARRPTTQPNRGAVSTQQRGFATPSRRPSSAPNQAPARGYARPQTAPPTSVSSPEELAQASTSRDAAREALAKVPWNALSPSAREKLAALAKNPTIYRRLPMAGGYCNPELFDFFLAHPHAVVGLWRQMGYDDVSMERVGPALYSIREKTGTVGKAQILYQDDELTLVYCSGKYQGPIVPRSLDGEMFLVLQTRYTEDPTGRPIVICRLDAFVDLKNPGADLLARTFSGALGKLADTNFEQTIAFIDSVSQTAETNPAALSGSIAGLAELSPEARRLFAAKTSEVARQAQLRANGVYVDYRLLPKLNSPTASVARVLSRERAGGAAIARANADAPTLGPGTFTPSTPESAVASGSLSVPTPRRETPSFNDFDAPSLAKNSFALSNDETVDDFDFEAELDWDDESFEVGGARVSEPNVSTLAPPTLVPETSVAKATARPSTKRGDALSLVVPNANADDAGAYQADKTLATDEAETGAPLLLDFESELLADANEPDDETLAPPALAQPVSPLAADAVALPADASTESNANADDADASDELALPVLVFDAETESDAAEDEATAADVPLLALPGADDAKPSAPKPAAPPQVALKPVVPKVAAPPKKEEKPAPAPVWRVVVPTPPSAAPTQSAAKPIAKTASLPDGKSATFRKPDIR